jgi:hypothetical protein
MATPDISGLAYPRRQAAVSPMPHLTIFGTNYGTKALRIEKAPLSRTRFPIIKTAKAAIETASIAPFSAFPLVLKPTIFEYLDKEDLIEMSQDEELSSDINAHFDSIERRQLSRLRTLRKEITSVDKITKLASRSVWGIISDQDKSKLWEVKSTSLDSPTKNRFPIFAYPSSCKASSATSSAQQPNATSRVSRNPLRKKTEVTINRTCASAAAKVAAAALRSQKIEAKRSPAEMKKQICSDRLTGIDLREKEIDELYYRSVFNIRFVSDKSNRVKVALKDLNSQTHNHLVDAALNSEETVEYAAASKSIPNQPPNNLYLYSSDSKVRRSPPGNLLNAREGDVIKTIDPSDGSSHVIIAMQEAVSRALGTPDVIPQVPFQRAISNK